MAASSHMSAEVSLVDAHVHIHSCFDLAPFLDAAMENFEAAAHDNHLDWPCPGLLMLTETAQADHFGLLRRHANEGVSDARTTLGNWRITPNAESISVTARRSDDATLVVIAGRQIVTAEGLEVLALATTAMLPDGEPVRKTLGAVSEADGIPVIPWGFGKWSGKRGRILKELLVEQNLFGFSLGDNSGRPHLLRPPQAFKYAWQNGIKVLPGTDPLPFPSQQYRAGSYGFWIERPVSGDTPAADLRAMLDEVDVHPYGHGEDLVSFALNQIAMQVSKRLRRSPTRGKPGESIGS